MVFSFFSSLYPFVCAHWNVDMNAAIVNISHGMHWRTEYYISNPNSYTILNYIFSAHIAPIQYFNVLRKTLQC